MSDSSNLKQKASKWTPFVFIILALFTPSLYANNCAISSLYETVKVAHVYDGDTVKLTDGRKLRLIGINTPERGRDGNNDQPFYLQAKNQLQKIIKKNHSQIKIVIGKERHDRYKRLLAHLYTLNDKNISAILLKKGLGFSIAIPPNIKLVTCYQEAEKEAKKINAGIWDHPFSQPIEVNSMSTNTLGFQQVKGTVQRVGESRSSFWLNLNSNSESNFALRILKKDLHYFTDFHPDKLLNHHLIARGWVYKIKSEQRITIRHPASLQIQNTDEM